MQEEAFLGPMIAIMGVAILASVVQGIAPAPPTVYTCPICGATFSTYDELYSHFTAEHPAEPIDIIWE